MKERVAARLLLASCTLALGIGLGTAIAVTGVLALRHPRLAVRSPGQSEGRLDGGVHQLFVSRPGSGGQPPLDGSPPTCAVTDVGTGQPAVPLPTGTGFQALRVQRSGRQRASCTSGLPVTVLVDHVGEGTTAYLVAGGRGLLVAVALTSLAAVWAARALLAVRRLGATPG